MKSITVLMLALLTIATPAVSDTTLTFGTSEWEPYLSETLPNGGVTADITKAAFKRAGYDAQVRFTEWNRAIGTKDSADKISHNIKKLLKGRIDLFLGSRLVTLDVINKSSARDGDNIAILDPPLKTNTLHLGISKKTAGYEKLLADFNNGLEQIKADGTVANIMKKHGF